ncbi:MAG: LysM peptidoglycan-binding domain-containing protein [Spirochaetes bacterium]|nr:LysM peptidoglycan-binding domain-containing protein [Spirochaetota bacterium]
MSRKICFLPVILLFLTFQVFAQHEPEIIMPEYNFAPYFAATVPGEEESSIPKNILNNEFYLESLRLNKLAQEAYDYGDYDASAKYAEEAIRYARLSDEYVAVKLIEEAKRLLHWADINNVVKRYPNKYNDGKKYYEKAVAAHSNDELENAIIVAVKSIEILSLLEAAMGKTAVLPKQYTVRTWAAEKDCLWNIAGYPWVYGNPDKWTELYEANKSKFPDPNNPNLIKPGMVLDIPSIKGEVRQGMWDSSLIYQAP